LYSQEDLDLVPEIALNLSRGCGNPTGFADLQPGEVVVDLGCGGGIDLVLAARKVGPGGKVVGVDMTHQMIERAKQTVAEAAVEGHVEFHVAEIGKVPLSDSFADVIISNCVINLVPDKAGVYGEAQRILRPGGRLAISDIVLTEDMSPELRERFQSTWSGCLGGALPENEYLQIIKSAGFSNLEILVRHALTPEELEAMACCPGEEYTPAPAKEDLAFVQGKVTSIKFIAVRE
jgi:ubiquinone/menaquinone biosynthesis C-methylase UbiE